jgi:hypothetical protein
MLEGRRNWIPIWVGFGALYVVRAVTARTEGGHIYWAAAAVLCAVGAWWHWTRPHRKRTAAPPTSLPWSNNAWHDPWRDDSF